MPSENETKMVLLCEVLFRAIVPSRRVGACVLVTTYDEYNDLLLYLAAYLCLSVRTFCFAKTTQIEKKTRPKPLGHEKCLLCPTEQTCTLLSPCYWCVCQTWADSDKTPGSADDYCPSSRGHRPSDPGLVAEDKTRQWAQRWKLR